MTKIDETTIDDAGDLNLVTPMYNLMKYSSNYSERTRSLWFYSQDEATNFYNNLANNNNFKSFEYKAKLLGNTVAQTAPNGANRNLNNATTSVSLNYLSSFWRSLEMTLIIVKSN